MSTTLSYEIILCGHQWYRQEWDDPTKPYAVTVSLAHSIRLWLWVVQYHTAPGVWFVVDGLQGDFGHEPVIAGPFDDMDAAAFAAITICAGE